MGLAFYKREAKNGANFSFAIYCNHVKGGRGQSSHPYI